MKPFVKNPSKRNGGSTEAQKYSWAFDRHLIATLKRKMRRNRRRTDKLSMLSKEYYE